MTIALTSAKRIDWARPEGCPAGFEPEFVVVGNSDAGSDITQAASVLPASQHRYQSAGLTDSQFFNG